jgi:NADH-quinone oxidoreductase subunit N
VILANFVAPELNYALIAPILVLFGASVFGVLIEAFVKREARRSAQLTLTFTALAVALLAVIMNYREERVSLGAVSALAIDSAGTFLQGLIIVVALVGALLLAEKNVDPQGDAFAPRASALPGSDDEVEFTRQGWLQTEIWPLFMFAVTGMVIFPVANDFLTLFVALEVMSLPLYLLAGMARRRRLVSQEAALKYFVLGAFSSAFLLYGAALFYGFSSRVDFDGIADAIAADSSRSGMLIVATLFVFVGLLFKVGAAPFHQWTPDVYQGAPTAVTAFMGAATKIAAFGALARVSFVALGGLAWDFEIVMWAIAGITMLVGTIVGVVQTDIKRMLAYSSIAHAGFLLLGIIAGNQAGLSAILFYLAAYGFTTLGTFAVVMLVRDSSGEVTSIADWAGLGKRSPIVAGTFGLFLLALAGIPLTSGFTGKFAVFAAAYDAGAAPLVVTAVIASMIAAFFYIRVMVLMFLTDGRNQEVSVVLPSIYGKVALGASVLVTVVLGVFPQPVLDLLTNAFFIR